LIYIGGAGGTGKLEVIKAIKKYFNRIDKGHTLVLCAPTGVAASNIGGCTIHSLCSFKFEDDNGSAYNFLQGILKKHYKNAGKT